MLRVYVETSVWGMVHPDRNPDLREATLEFFAECTRGVFSPYISSLVLREVRQASKDVQEIILGQIQASAPTVLAVSTEAVTMAQRFIEHGVLSAKRWNDSLHVACAMVSGLDLLVSWNYRHIVNVSRVERFQAVAVLDGFKSELSIHSPLEVLEWQ